MKNLIACIGIRFLSLLLSYHFPETHNALKPREWKDLLQIVNHEYRPPQGIRAESNMELFARNVEALRLRIMKIPEIQKIKGMLTSGIEFQDYDFRWMSQDVILCNFEEH